MSRLFAWIDAHRAICTAFVVLMALSMESMADLAVWAVA